ncbi:MAG: hypothetical protein IT364_18555 [Candidatus Hydrogenedentes bacterium]|nr:hypothetical protein [Candidatus Hydrogenedentota bacterium]
MKLIIREYLSSLKERGELDAVLPDLLSQLGLNVYSRPARGTRQDGVDVGAVGSLDGGAEKVYLFSIKPGDLTRRDWDGDSAQSLRPSLNEIIDSYIPNRLPAEHRGKDIVICIAIGGDVQEPVRSLVTGFIGQNTKGNITFEEWNGDKLASCIQSSFLREDLLPDHARSHLRKSLAMLDEPDVSYRHFAELIRLLSAVDELNDVQRVTSMRQMSICLWILYGWAREAENIEAAYRAGELTLLNAWSIAKRHAGKDNKTTRAMQAALSSVFTAYHQICSEFLRVNVLPYADKLHAVSSAVWGSNILDVNLKLFDLLGRLGLDALWASWGAQRCSDDEVAAREAMLGEAQRCVEAIKTLINNNPTLFLPLKDEQGIDISIALSALIMDGGSRDFILTWLSEMLGRAKFAYEAHMKYPSVLCSYTELLDHPKSREDDYRKNVTSGSILYPVIALWAALLQDQRLYRDVAQVQELMQHCTYQLWYPDERSEDHFYKNSDAHGAVLANLALNISEKEFLAQVFGECEETKYFEDLSAVKYGWWPLIIVACRHYRLPLPLHLLNGLRSQDATNPADTTVSTDTASVSEKSNGISA